MEGNIEFISMKNDGVNIFLRASNIVVCRSNGLKATFPKVKHYVDTLNVSATTKFRRAARSTENSGKGLFTER